MKRPGQVVHNNDDDGFVEIVKQFDSDSEPLGPGGRAWFIAIMEMAKEANPTEWYVRTIGKLSLSLAFVDQNHTIVG